jgi:hypothetical protein
MWIYEQSNGKVIDRDGCVRGMGYSGFADGKNNPSKQDVSNIGPLPRGIYKMTELFDSPVHGPACIRLQPLPETELFGRSGFLIHGDSKVHPGMASHGCIIQLHDVRLQMWNSGDRLVEVTA